MDLTGKVIIITGASAGIGAATAIESARAGMDVVLNARRADRLEVVAREIEAMGRRSHMVAVDCSGSDANTCLLDAAESTFGRFDCVFANAGYGMEKRLTSVSMSELRAMFEVNFFSAVELLKLAADRLIAQRRQGHLLMCSSVVSNLTIPGYGPYCATKSAQAHICRAMRHELRPYGIRVSSVHPSTTRTEFHDVAMRMAGRDGEDSTRESLPDHAPSFFVQSPQRVASAVVRAIRRGHSEVWLSRTVRFAAGLMTICPPLGEIVMGRLARMLPKE